MVGRSHDDDAAALALFLLGNVLLLATTSLRFGGPIAVSTVKAARGLKLGGIALRFPTKGLYTFQSAQPGYDTHFNGLKKKEKERDIIEIHPTERWCELDSVASK